MAPAQGGTLNQAIGRSCGGLTTKIAALVDGLGNLVRFVLLPGQRHDLKSVDDLLAGIACEAFIGDKAFDAKALRERLAEESPPLAPVPCSAIPSIADLLQIGGEEP